MQCESYWGKFICEEEAGHQTMHRHGFLVDSPTDIGVVKVMWETGDEDSPNPANHE